MHVIFTLFTFCKWLVCCLKLAFTDLIEMMMMIMMMTRNVSYFSLKHIQPTQNRS